MGFFSRAKSPTGDLRSTGEPEGYSYRGMGVYLPEIRRFHLVRERDVSGVSGTGLVAEGVMFADGTCALRWRSELTSTAIYPDVVTLEKIHGHGGATRLKWLDD